MVQAGWIVPAGDRFRFARPALREAVYRAISEDSRARLHAQAARALDPGSGKSLSITDAFQRAFHLRAAGDPQSLLRVLRPLLAAMAKRGQTQRVHSIARWGLEGLDALPRTKAREILRIEFLEAAADAADRLGYRSEQRDWLDQLSDLELSPEKDPKSLARVYLLHARHAVSTGQFGLARGFLKNAVELAERADDSAVLVSEAQRRLSAVQAHVGELHQARKLALSALDNAVHEPQRAVARLQLGVVDLLEDDLEAALREVDRALVLLRNSHDWTLPNVLAIAHMLRGRIYRLLGRPGRALGSMQHAVRLARASAERRLEMEATARLGGLLLDLNRAEEAEARLRDALLMANEIEDRRGQTLAGLWLGILLWEQGDPEAAGLLSNVSRMAREMGLSRAEALCLAIQARTTFARGDLEEALQDSERAMELLERHGAELADRIVITGTRALMLHAAGLHDAGAQMMKELRRRLRRESDRLGKDELRRSHRETTRRLLESVLSDRGPIYPRAAVESEPSSS
jgi:tetratricopeptide (TPR) repeat protein